MNNRLSIEVLHARRPTLNYVSPAICEAAFSGSSTSLVLDTSSGLGPITGLDVEYLADQGLFRVFWDPYPGALCYNVYRANNPNEPGGAFTLLLSCHPTPYFFTPDCPECFLVTAVTLLGETPFAGPVCTVCPPGSGTIYFNTEQTVSCAEGETGVPSSVTKAAGTYTSPISQANADAKALAAAQHDLHCCVLPTYYYKTSHENADTFDAGPAPEDSVTASYGMIVVANSLPLNLKLGNSTPVNQTYANVEITHSRGAPYATYNYDALAHWPDAGIGIVGPGQYTETGWTIFNLGFPSEGQAPYFPKTFWNMTLHIFGGSTQSVGELIWPGSDKIKVFWVGGPPPCP